MKVTKEFKKIATDFIAQGEGFAIDKPGVLYGKRLLNNSYLMIEKTDDEEYSVYKLKYTPLGDELSFLQAIELSKKENEIISGIEDYLDWCRELDEEDNVIEFASKKKRF